MLNGTRPVTSGYERIAQAEEEQEEEYYDESEGDDFTRGNRTAPLITTNYAPIQPERRSRMQASRTESFNGHDYSQKYSAGHRRERSNSGIDIKALNARLERWAEEIAQKFKLRKIKGKTQEEEKLEIHHSVFQAPDDIRPATAEMLASTFDEQKMTKSQFDDIVESIRVAIELGIHPKMISQGSSGSYFARNSEGKVVGVFKPKDEEPYASRNPKWTKWIHRNLFPFFFGRACLIPNLSYVSEAAAHVLDRRLQTNVVPYTDVVHFSSIAFNHDFWDRRAYYRKRKPLPEKVGSLQVFLEGYKDASLFLKQNPWPDGHGSSPISNANPRARRRRWAEECRPRADDISSDEEADATSILDQSSRVSSRRGLWTESHQQSFREQLEKLVILDYIMRNTDRGLDNWMIKVNETTQEVAVVADAIKEQSQLAHDSTSPDRSVESSSDPYKRQHPMSASNGDASALNASKSSFVSLGAIDNSLSWPWKHPDAWRSYPFGWLFLPVSLIGQPFSEKTRKHFLPLLTSKQWWTDTQIALRQCFEQDSDFQERMFARQMAVMKGQAWNVCETLKTAEHGPLELTRRARVCVWDDLVEIPTVVHLREASAEMRRQREANDDERLEEEEMDISSAYSAGASTAAVHDPSPSTGRSQRNPFDLPRYSRPEEATDLQAETLAAYRRDPLDAPQQDLGEGRTQAPRPAPLRTRARMSYDGPRSSRNLRQVIGRQRNRSFTMRRVNSGTFDHHGDDVEGDLGYAAAEVMEGNRRKVIVERLENVKGKNPVFTWC